MKPSKAIELTSKELHSNLLSNLLVSIEQNQGLPEPERSVVIASTAHLVAKEIYGQAREILNERFVQGQNRETNLT
jgi:hypothetical protein